MPYTILIVIEIAWTMQAKSLLIWYLHFIITVKNPVWYVYDSIISRDLWKPSTKDFWWRSPWVILKAEEGLARL